MYQKCQIKTAKSQLVKFAFQVFNLAAAAAAAAGSSPSNPPAAKKRCVVAEQDADPAEPPEDAEDNAPLFYSPGKRGFYSPIQGRNSTLSTISILQK